MHEIYISVPLWPGGPAFFHGMSIKEAIEKHGYVPKENDDMAKKQNGFLSEDHFQMEAFKWVWNTYPELRRTFFHAANEGNKNIVQAKRDEAKGLLAGVYDFTFLLPRFVVELKQPGGALSPNQVKFKEAMDKHGIPNYIAYYMEEFQGIVRMEFAKLRLG